MMAQHTLMSVLKYTKPELEEVLTQFCAMKGDKWWYHPSPNYPNAVTLVAHIDTVWDNDYRAGKYKWDDKANKLINTTPTTPVVRRRIYFDRKEGVVWSPEGLGADDRAGVFALLYLWENLPDVYKPNLLFTDLEETGAQGARQAAKDLLPQLCSTFAFIEFDRKNGNDAVFYNDEPKEFRDFITSFGYVADTGSFSDISVLGKEAEICAVNLSCGYYEQHTKAEHLCVAELFASIKKATPMIGRLVEDKKVWNNPKPVKTPSSWRGYGAQAYNGHSAMCCCEECILQDSLDTSPYGLGNGYWPHERYLQGEHSQVQQALFGGHPPKKGGKKNRKKSHVLNGPPHHRACGCIVCNFRKKNPEWKGELPVGEASTEKVTPSIPAKSRVVEMSDPHNVFVPRSVVDSDRIVIPTNQPKRLSIDPPVKKEEKWWMWNKGR